MYIIGGSDVEHLKAPVVVDRYECRYRLTTKAGTHIYFTGIASRKEIELRQFTLAVKIIKERDTYVLTPDAVNPSRHSYLILLNYTKDTEVVGFKQRVLFDLYYHDKEARQIIALAREFPEVFDSSDYLMLVGYNRTAPVADAPISYDVAVRPTGLDVYRKQPPKYGNFIMYGKYDSCGGMTMYHPATKFVIHEENIIFTKIGITNQMICEFLNLESLPKNVTVTWLSESLGEVRSLVRDIRNAIPKDKSLQAYQFVAIGFSYEQIAELRSVFSEFYEPRERRG